MMSTFAMAVVYAVLFWFGAILFSYKAVQIWEREHASPVFISSGKMPVTLTEPRGPAPLTFQDSEAPHCKLIFEKTMKAAGDANDPNALGLEFEGRDGTKWRATWLKEAK